MILLPFGRGGELPSDCGAVHQVSSACQVHGVTTQCILRGAKPFYSATNDGIRTEVNHILTGQDQLVSQTTCPQISIQGGHYLSNGAIKSPFLCGKSKKMYVYSNI